MSEKKKIKLTFKCPKCGHTQLFTREMAPVYQEVLEVEATHTDKSRPLEIHDWDLDESDWGDSETLYDSADTSTFEYTCGNCDSSWKTLRDVAKSGGLVDENGNACTEYAE